MKAVKEYGEWVKASESKPDNWDDAICRRISDGCLITGVWRFGENSLELDNNGRVCGDEIWYTDVEWLRPTTGILLQKSEYEALMKCVESSGWISVNDSKPDTDSLLLTASGICIIGDWYKEGWRTHKSHWEKDENGVNRYVSAYKDESITHWQPLPLPPNNQLTQLP